MMWLLIVAGGMELWKFIQQSAHAGHDHHSHWITVAFFRPSGDTFNVKTSSNNQYKADHVGSHSFSKQK